MIDIDDCDLCQAYNGTGEGWMDGAVCRVCHGSGVVEPLCDDKEDEGCYLLDKQRDDKLTGDWP